MWPLLMIGLLFVFLWVGFISSNKVDNFIIDSEKLLITDEVNYKDYIQYK